jgi:hypothetical protein
VCNLGFNHYPGIGLGKMGFPPAILLTWWKTVSLFYMDKVIPRGEDYRENKTHLGMREGHPNE